MRKKAPSHPSASTPAPLPVVGRMEAMRHLLHIRHVRDSFRLAQQPSLRNSALAGLQAALTAAIALPFFHLSQWSHLIGFASLGALVALFGRFAPQRGRHYILFLCGLCQTLAVLSMSVAAWLGASQMVQFGLLSLACGLFFFVSGRGRFGAPGPLIFVFAASASMSNGLAISDVIERTAATAAVAGLAWIICTASEMFRHYGSDERPLPAEPSRPLKSQLIATGRITIGAGFAVFASHALGAAHPAWAAMGALAVMQGAHLHISMNRALQRMAGTVVGAMLAWMVLVQEPSVWAIIALLVGLQFVTEVVIGANYALGQILVTPMALLMTHLAMPNAPGAAMAPERVMDTVLGAVIGLGVAVFFSTLDDRRYLTHHHPA